MKRTERPAESVEPVTTATLRSADTSIGWLNIALGVIFLIVFNRFWFWLLSLAGIGEFTWTFTDTDGSPLAYTETLFFWGDLAISLFCFCILLEGVAIVFRLPRAVVLGIGGLIAVSTLLNVGYVGVMLANGYGLQIPSALATVFGIFMFFQLRDLIVQR
ncbi:MAG: hypothetical protein AAGD32_09770 [Planctomycetota bacterium]